MRIFLIGLSEGLARSVARYVRSDPRIVLAGVAPSIALAGIMLPSGDSTLALVDWAALGGSAGDGFLALRQGRPGLRIACVADEAESYHSAAAQAGADAVISLDRFAGELDFLLRMFFAERFPTQGGHHA